MNILDDLDLPLTVAGDEAARHYRHAIDLHLHAWPGARAALEEAIALDPAFALAHAALALTQASAGERGAALESIGRAQALAGSGLTPREIAHIGILVHIMNGRPRDALAAVREHARSWPRDAFVLGTALGAFGLMAFSGDADHDCQRLDFIDALAPHYPAEHTWMVTQRAWTRIECGQLAEGNDLVRRSLALRSRNGNAAHVQMHALFELGEHRHALAFIEQWSPCYPSSAILYGHLQWHAALAHIGLGELDGARARLDDVIVPLLDDGLPLVGLTDIASLLWRLMILGQRDLPWSLGCAFARRNWPGGGHPFVEIHLSALAAATGDDPALAAVIERLQAVAARGHAGAAVALDWVEGLRSLRAGDRQAGAARLRAARENRVRVGGSHAQRTLLEVTEQAMPDLTRARISCGPG